MSIGNRVFKDDGTGGGTYNNGIMDGGELPVSGVRVELWHDANTDGVPDVGGLVDFDITDAGGYYLFDDLAPGSYVVVIPFGNFTASFDPDGGGPLPTAAGALLGYNTSTPTGTENTGVTGDPYSPSTDRDDNGLNVGTAPTTGGVRSGTITLTYNTEASNELELSGDNASPGSMTFDPTGWDGPTPGSRGRWGEADDNSNLTIDFGFTPVFSLGNRVWFDTDNSGTINGTEVGISGVNVHLFASDGTTEIPVGPDGNLNTADDNTTGVTTDTNGYYLFNNLQAGDYLVRIPSTNFGVGQPLNGYWSSATSRLSTGAITETTAPDADNVPPGTDSDDNGTLVSGNVDLSVVTLGPTASEPVAPANETDIPASGQGQPDAQANMTVDFGFYTMTLGNLIWNDNGIAAGHNNNGIFDTDESGIDNVTVELWSGDGSTQIGSTITAGGGIYTFTGLPAGDYIVRLPAGDFNPTGVLRDYRSSTGPLPATAYEPAKDADTDTTDLDDNGSETNGLLGLGGYIQTLPVTLTSGW